MVGVSWNNYSQERWAKADEPAMKAAIAAAGGSYIRADANDKAEQQLTDIDSLITQGAEGPHRPRQGLRGDQAGDRQGKRRRHPGHRV